jgi:hypothetical protein
MAISNFLIRGDWDTISSQYNSIDPDVLTTKTGTPKSNFSVTWYLKKNTTKSFILALNANSEVDSVSFSLDTNTADQLSITFQDTTRTQGTIYYSFDESQDWGTFFSFTISYVDKNDSTKKGTYKFSKRLQAPPDRRGHNH